MAIKTPQTHPDHEVVGHFFVAHGGIYYCDSYDTSQGYWMTNILKDERTNVSERAIDRTFHTVRFFPEFTPYSMWGQLSDQERRAIEEYKDQIKPSLVERN